MEKGGLTDALTQAGVSQQTEVAFGDEMRVGLCGQVRRVWAPRGRTVTPAVPSVRRWGALVLVVDGRAGRRWWSWPREMTAARRAPTVAVWRPAGNDAVIWDRAPAHQTATVHQQGVPLIAQPPFRPAVHPADRVVEEVRRAVAGKGDATRGEHDAAVRAVRAAVDADPARLRRLAGWQWLDIDQPLAALPDHQQIAA